MSRRCKPGQRARIIGGGANHGAIVLVVRPYFYPDKVSDSTWPRQQRPWVITSLGQPLQSFYLDGREAPARQTIVCDDRDLEPLGDDEGGVSDEEVLGRPVLFEASSEVG